MILDISLSLTLATLALLCRTCHSAPESQVVELESITMEDKLPYGIGFMETLYDGVDSVYLLGGFGVHPESGKNILKYSAASDTVEIFGSMDDVERGGAALVDKTKILYFGGEKLGSESRQILSLRTTAPNDWSVVGELPGELGYTNCVWDQGEYVYLLGGRAGRDPPSNIIRYSKSTNTLLAVAELPTARTVSSAVWDNKDRVVYIFGGQDKDNFLLRDILKFNPVDNTVTKLNVTLPPLATAPEAFTCAVWNGEDVYILGGLSRQISSSIVRFNPSRNEVTLIPVKNFPTVLFGHGCAFIPTLNRIYIYGGHDGTPNGSYNSKVRYIELGERPGKPGPNCNGVVDGTQLKDPYCCKSFYQCERNVALLQHCPEALHFSPATSECENPDIAKCITSYQY